MKKRRFLVSSLSIVFMLLVSFQLSTILNESTPSETDESHKISGWAVSESHGQNVSDFTSDQNLTGAITLATTTQLSLNVPLTIYACSTFTISGKLTGESNKLHVGLRNKEIHITSDCGLDETTTTHSEGFFSISAVAPDISEQKATFQVAASFAGDEDFTSSFASTTITVTKGKPAVLTIVYVYGRTCSLSVKGYLRTANGPEMPLLAQMTVKIYLDGIHVGSCTTDRYGGFYLYDYVEMSKGMHEVEAVFEGGSGYGLSHAERTFAVYW